MINLNDILTDANVQNFLYGVMSLIGGLAVAEYKKHVKGTKIDKAAYDAWHIVEEYFRLNPDAKQSAEDKIKFFKSILQKKFPNITDDELNWLNKSIAGMMNSDKQCEELKVNTSPVDESTITLVPEIKYYTPDGKELVLKEE